MSLYVQILMNAVKVPTGVISIVIISWVATCVAVILAISWTLMDTLAMVRAL